MAAPLDLSPRMPVPVHPAIFIRPPPLVSIAPLRPMTSPFPNPPSNSQDPSSPKSADKAKQASRRVCLDYVKGKCQRPQCKFLHPDLGHVQNRFQDLSGGGQGGVCEVYILTGQCKFGAACFKRHPALLPSVSVGSPSTKRKPPTSRRVPLPVRVPSSTEAEFEDFAVSLLTAAEPVRAVSEAESVRSLSTSCGPTSPTNAAFTRGESSCSGVSPLLAQGPQDQIFLDILQDLRLQSC